MNSNKSADTRESSVSKSDMDDSQHKDDDNRRNNAGGYSWWKWRRSTDSTEKKSPSKEIEDIKSTRQSVERVDEMKDIISDLDSLTLGDATATESKLEPLVEAQVSAQNLSVDNDLIGRNDDSISSEIADVSKSSFVCEKYRKTLRLTSDQIVSCDDLLEQNERNWFHILFRRRASTWNPVWMSWSLVWRLRIKGRLAVSATCSAGSTRTKWWFRISTVLSPNRMFWDIYCRWWERTGPNLASPNCSRKSSEMATNCSIYRLAPLANHEPHATIYARSNKEMLNYQTDRCCWIQLHWYQLSIEK